MSAEFKVENFILLAVISGPRISAKQQPSDRLINFLDFGLCEVEWVVLDVVTF